MAEYTYEDIIIDPDDPRLEGAIGKECYFSDFPKKVLNSARNNSSEYLDCLTNISKEKPFPFTCEKGFGYNLIIIKKEEQKTNPKYVPFGNVAEFIDAYRNTTGCLNEEDYYISNNGIWIKGKASEAYYMVTKIWDIGVSVVDDPDETSWGELLKYYTFLDGTPCGKLSEEEQ